MILQYLSMMMDKHICIGESALYYVKLNEDMISFDRSIGNNGIVAVDMTTEAFGTRVDGDERHQTLYEEGPWFTSAKRFVL